MAKRKNRERRQFIPSARREDANSLTSVIYAWCDVYGFEFIESNHGRHWIIKRDGLRAEYWPGGGTYAFNFEYGKKLPKARSAIHFLELVHTSDSQTRFPC